jgi:hypothetical protein
MANRSLDVPCRQVLIDFFDDEDEMFWHQRLLLVGSGSNDGRFVACTPDLELQVLSLTSHRVVPLLNDAAIPADYVPYAYLFDPLGPGDWDMISRQATSLAEVMGFASAVSESGFVWVVNDTAVEMFGAEVPLEALASAESCVQRDNVGLVRVDGKWLSMEKVDKLKLPEWKAAKAKFVGDSRTFAPVRINGRRFISEAESFSKWRMAKIDDSHFSGPSAVREFFQSLTSSGQTLIQHRLDFVKKSGVPERGHIAKELENLCETLRIALQVDQLDGSGCLFVEQLVRRILQIQYAVAKNPKMPDWEGVEAIMSPAINDIGGVATSTFADWVSTRQQTEAQRMKQGRLLREERETEKKRSAKNKPPKEAE